MLQKYEMKDIIAIILQKIRLRKQTPTIERINSHNSPHRLKLRLGSGTPKNVKPELLGDGGITGFLFPGATPVFVLSLLGGLVLEFVVLLVVWGAILVAGEAWTGAGPALSELDS